MKLQKLSRNKHRSKSQRQRPQHRPPPRRRIIDKRLCNPQDIPRRSNSLRRRFTRNVKIEGDGEVDYTRAMEEMDCCHGGVEEVECVEGGGGDGGLGGPLVAERAGEGGWPDVELICDVSF